MEDVIVPVVAIFCIFVVLPAILLNSMTQWKKSRSLSVEDENLMDELHSLARRLSDRMDTVERLVAADNPSFRPGLSRGDDGYAALADDRHDGRRDDRRGPREDDLLGRRDLDAEQDRSRSRFERR